MDLQKSLSMKISPGMCLLISHKNQSIPCDYHTMLSAQNKKRSKIKDEAPIVFCQKRQARLSCMSVLENLLPRHSDLFGKPGIHYSHLWEFCLQF